MTPQLQQAIKLLQLNNLELSAYVDQELEENPLLERDEGDPPQEDPGEPTDDDFDAAAGGDGGDGDVDEDMEFAAAEDIPLDVDVDNVWNNDGAQDFPMAERAGGLDGPGLTVDQTLADTVSLRDHLLQQLSMDLSDSQDMMIGVHLIDMVDEAGYIDGDLDRVAEELGCGSERVEQTLARVQEFDPPGIFARTLAECLRLQLRDQDRLDPAMEIFVDNLDMVAKRELTALAGLCGVDAEDLADMVDEIKALDPKPALAFDHTPAQLVVPDVIMRVRPGGGWSIELNSATLPRVLVNNKYHAEIKGAARSREDKQFINDCFQSANWLVKSLHQRATTILKVATEIARQQDGFFANGVQYLRPLVLRDIADAIDMHESTVSRVTSNKYVSTPRGIYELKYFFTPAIASSSGGASHSAESVRHRIREIIEAEKADGVFSDDKIVEVLKGYGVDIARRTVAKYREAMRIPSSVQRRRDKARP